MTLDLCDSLSDFLIPSTHDCIVDRWPSNTAIEGTFSFRVHAIMSPTGYVRLEFGRDMGLYFTFMVIWAITITKNNRLNTSCLHDQPSEDILCANSSTNTSHLLAFRYGKSSFANRTSSASTSTSIFQIVRGSIEFLEIFKAKVAGLSPIPRWLRHNARSQQGLRQDTYYYW